MWLTLVGSELVCWQCVQAEELRAKRLIQDIARERLAEYEEEQGND